MTRRLFYLILLSSLFFIPVIIFFFLADLSGPKSVQAATTITVNTLDDENNTDGDCSLREAIIAADTNTATDNCLAGTDPGPDVIQFSVDGTITLVSIPLRVNTAISIDGSGHTIAVDGAGGRRVLEVMAGGSLIVDNITVQNGNTATDGGGIYNAGTLTLNHVTLSGNIAGDQGGGIYSYGTVMVTNSTFSGNDAANQGGGIFNTVGAVTVTNSTFSGNTATNQGGGIYNVGTVTLTHATFSGNNAATGGGINNAGGTLRLAGSLFQQGASGANCSNSSVLVDNGYNLSSDATCISGGTGSLANTTLNLGGLSGGGAGQQVHTPQPGSAAIGRIPNGTTVNNNGVTLACNGSTADQLGSTRPINAGTDCTSGAVEVAVVPVNLTINDVALNEGNSGPTTFSFTVSLSSPAGFGGVTFDIATADGTATTADNDYVSRSLTGQTIPANSSTYTFDVTVNGDIVSEGVEVFFVNVTNVTGATVTDGQGQGTILNDDTVGVTVNPTSGLLTTEAGGTDTFTISLTSQPAGSADVTIPLTSSNTAEGTVPASVTIPNADWSTGVLVTVTGVDDAIADGNIAYTIITGDPTSGDPLYNLLTAADVADVSVTNQDNDVPAILVNPTSGLVTTEAGGTDTFTISLALQPAGGADVTIPLTSSNTAEGTVPASVTILNADWSTGVLVTVTGVDDLVPDGDMAYTIITGDPTSGDAAYDALTAADVADVSVTNQDNDSPPLADDDSYSTTKNRTLTVDAANGVLNGDTGGNGNPLQAMLDSNPTQGTLNAFNTDGSFEYAPNAGFIGTDTFTYHATDGTNDSNVATVTITVTPLLGRVIARDDYTDTSTGRPITIDVLANDVDEAGNPLHIEDVAGLDNGDVHVKNGKIIYTPDAGFVGSEIFTYRAANDYGGSDTATVLVAVWQPVPLCADFDGSTNEIIRADVPGGTVTDGSVFCRVLVENNVFVRASAEVGRSEVLNRGVIQAVDVFALHHDGSPTAYFNNTISVCLQGGGVFLYLDATVAPRAVVELPVYLQSGYTCASVPNAGTVVLVSGSASTVNPAPEVTMPTGPTTTLMGCMVTTRDILNFRDQPGTSSHVIRMIPYNVTLTALERTSGWFYVDYLGERGWISAGFVTPQGTCGQ